MALTKLDAVNVLIGKLGQRPVNSLETAHPLVASALALIDRHSRKFQARKWWFNTEFPTLTPQVGNKRITLPGDTLSVDAVDRTPRVAARGRFLYNLDDSTLEFDEPLQVQLHRLVAFEDLPHNAAEAVLAAAVLEWLTDRDGDGEKLRVALGDKQATWAAVHAEHIRSSQRNLLTRPSMQRRMNLIQGPTPYYRTR